MKRFKKLLIAISGLALSVGAAVGVGLGFEKDFNKADAAGTFTLFIGAWGDANMAEGTANAGINYWGGSNGMADITRIGSTLWYANVPNNITGFQILRVNKNKTIASDGSDAIWNYSQDITFDSNKTWVYLKGYSGDKLTYEYEANSGKKQLLAGTRYYLDTRDVKSFWGTVSGEKTKMVTFADDFYGAYTNWNTMTRVGDSYLYYWDVTTPTLCQAAIPVRVKDNSVSSWTKDVWNQTTDVTDLSKNTIYVHNTQSVYPKYDWGVDNKVANELVSDSFSLYFLDATNGYCDASVSTSGITSTYSVLDTTASGSKALFYGAEVKRGKGVSYASNASQAISRYANMQEEKGYTDFLSLGANNPARNINKTVAEITNPDSNNPLLIIIASSLVTFLAVGGYFFIRRKADR